MTNQNKDKPCVHKCRHVFVRLLFCQGKSGICCLDGLFKCADLQPLVLQFGAQIVVFRQQTFNDSPHIFYFSSEKKQSAAKTFIAARGCNNLAFANSFLNCSSSTESVCCDATFISDETGLEEMSGANTLLWNGMGLLRHEIL